jgi:hypothetical protein
MGRGVEAAAAPDATLIVLSFIPAKRRMLPRGASAEDIERAFPGWRVREEQSMSTEHMPAPVQKAKPRLYLLKRAG